MGKYPTKLRLVPFDPKDYSLAKPLTRENQAELLGIEAASALSLYFQWPNHRQSRVAREGDVLKVVCEIDYDRDERTPTELVVHVPDKNLQVNLREKLVVQFEIFRVCYQFTTTVLLIRETSNSSVFVVDVPESLLVYRNRKLPRMDLASLQEKPQIEWTSDRGKRIYLRVTQLGMNSLCTDPKPGFEGERGTFQIQGYEFQATLVRTTDAALVFALEFRDGREAGIFFDFYKRFAYPSLVSRHDVPYEVGFNLYAETGYFEKFLVNKDNEYMLELCNVWKRTKSGFHETTADYYTTDSSGVVSGCSGVALAFHHGDTPIWAFHQLCAKKIPNLLINSGQLYLWRAEYLAARPETLRIIGWYDGRSRWLERIYSKFAQNCSSDSSLDPVQGQKCTFKRAVGKKINAKRYLIGDAPRYSTSRKDALIAQGPRLLNAGGHLNGIVAIWDKKSIAEISSLGSALAEESGLEEVTAKVTVPVDFDISGLGGMKQVENRLISMSKDDLMSFLSSVEHSVAVTERKLMGS